MCSKIEKKGVKVKMTLSLYTGRLNFLPLKFQLSVNGASYTVGNLTQASLPVKFNMWLYIRYNNIQYTFAQTVTTDSN